MSRYQGIVALEGQSIEDAAHQYFRQSEQIPTRIRIAVGETVTRLTMAPAIPGGPAG